MRRLLGAVRARTTGRRPGWPRSRASPRCPTLVDRVRAAGLPVQLEVDGEPAALPAERRPVGVPDRAGGADQHPQARGAGAPGRACSWTPAASTSTSRSPTTARGAPPRPATGHGNGLRGIAERVNLLGGELTSGRPGGGFAVRVRLPVAPGCTAR